MSHDDFDVEPIRGLPAVPPEDEKILWQGSPHWPAVARRVMHIDWIAGYFALLLGWRVASGGVSGSSVAEFVGSLAPSILLAATAIGVLTLLAWAVGRTTVYTITSRRIVLRFGVALPITYNLPFATFANVATRKFSPDVGDIAVELSGGQRIAYLVLWPHVRPWNLKCPQPMLRCVPDIEGVSKTLARALAAHGGRSVARLPEAAIATPATTREPLASARPVLEAAE